MRIYADFVKHKLETIDKIDKNVSVISAKLSDLEHKLKSMDSRLADTEKFCEFISRDNDTVKHDLQKATDELSALKKTCQKVERQSQELQSQNEQMDE